MGSGIQKTTLWLRFFTNFAKQLGYVGTWGQGYNSMNNIHVIDCANAILTVFKAALEGKAEEGAEGLCKQLMSDIELRIETDSMQTLPPRTSGESLTANGQKLWVTTFTLKACLSTLARARCLTK